MSLGDTRMAMISWNDAELARARHEDFAREAAADRLANEAHREVRDRVRVEAPRVFAAAIVAAALAALLR